jgi:hypothetical protein
MRSRISVRHITLLPSMANVQLTPGPMSEYHLRRFRSLEIAIQYFQHVDLLVGLVLKRGGTVTLDAKSVVTVRL